MIVIDHMKKKTNGKTLPRWNYHYYLPEFIYTTQVTVKNDGVISLVPWKSHKPLNKPKRWKLALKIRYVNQLKPVEK